MLTKKMQCLIKSMSDEQKLILGVKGRNSLLNEGMSNAQAAKALGVSPAALSYVGTGERLPSKSMIESLIQYLRLDAKGLDHFCSVPEHYPQLLTLTLDKSEEELDLIFKMILRAQSKRLLEDLRDPDSPD